ncbi:50S ribosomal protein L29 [Candidatus Cytomitobacter primus]|uniref:Large ribosomal subunit protein uL29 n=1 Tax=Candidatus Cytomitobacter primus TaxID=2066024 RepID=A0A5C0UGQ8_9PROT|nr:50S ribosomal protein L29 [Candidatus Cytomitobacter primus]
MSEKLLELMSSYLELKFQHSKKALKNTSELKKIRRKIAKMKTIEVKND